MLRRLYLFISETEAVPAFTPAAARALFSSGVDGVALVDFLDYRDALARANYEGKDPALKSDDDAKGGTAAAGQRRLLSSVVSSLGFPFNVQCTAFSKYKCGRRNRRPCAPTRRRSAPSSRRRPAPRRGR